MIIIYLFFHSHFHLNRIKFIFGISPQVALGCGEDAKLKVKIIYFMFIFELIYLRVSIKPNGRHNLIVLNLRGNEAITNLQSIFDCDSLSVCRWDCCIGNILLAALHISGETMKTLSIAPRE